MGRRTTGSEIISSFVHRSREPAGLSILTADLVNYADVLAWTRSFGYSFAVLPATDWLSNVAEDPRKSDVYQFAMPQFRTIPSGTRKRSSKRHTTLPNCT